MSEKTSQLIDQLYATAQKLQELTGGQVDAVSRDGRTYLLPTAQDYLRNREAVKQAAILDGLPAHIALLNNDGVIVSVNDSWRKFSEANRTGLPQGEVGKNYLNICSAASDGDPREAIQVVEGIESVLRGESKNYSLEYPCHSPTEQRWFMLMVSPLTDDRQTGAIVMHVDITQKTLAAIDRKLMDDELFESKERAHVALNCLGDAVACVDISGNVTFLNLVAAELTGFSLETALGQPIARVMHSQGSSGPMAEPVSLETMEGRPASLSSHSTMTRNGKEIALDYTMALTFDRNKLVTGGVYVFRDVTKERQLSLQTAYSAQHDFLTGLPNRTLLSDRIGNAIAQAARHKKKVVVLFLDLDGFKHINDSLGHLIGDILLQSVAKKLQSCVRTGDTVCRQGGDEFIILLHEVSNLLDAANKADQLLKSLALTHSTAHHDLHVSGSIGISVYPDDGQDAETLIKNADTAMYQAKANGRQSYQFFTAAMNARAVDRQVIEESLRRALKGKEFELYYQPKINLRTRKITGAEALLRWKHPTRGMIEPSEFIPVAEDSGLIVGIGTWVLRMACQQAKAWRDAGLPKLVMSVNVSAAEFSDKNFLEGVLTVLRETEMAPDRLELELTESVLMKRPDTAVTILQTLRNKGISIAIDDFGTGYSSLSYLRKFPVDALKIDQSFVSQIESDGEDTVIVKAVIGMARNLKMRVVAEGVETLEQMQFLGAHQCQEVQGYYFSKPLPADQFAELLREGVSSNFYSDSESNQQRKNRRHRVLKDGKIVSADMQCVTDVKIRDLSDEGALVLLPANINLPKVFSLLIVSERLLYPAVACWRKSGSAGLQFVGKPHATAIRIDKSR
ncbi:MAG TPA: EAL domain-containing protein [Aestuariivirga sp.]